MTSVELRRALASSTSVGSLAQFVSEVRTWVSSPNETTCATTTTRTSPDTTDHTSDHSLIENFPREDLNQERAVRLPSS